VRRTALALIGLALACAAFGYWGLGTAGGGAAFDEMDGLIPFFVAVLGALLDLAGLLLWAISARRRHAAERVR